MIQFIHTADIHFGMENYGRIDPHTGVHSRLLDFEQALNMCVDTAISQEVDFFLFAGDAYKTANPSPTQQRLLMRCFMRLYRAHIPVIIIIGNHDNPLSHGKAHALDVFADLPLDGFHVFAKPRLLLLNTKSGPIQIVGIPWPARTNITLAEKYTHRSAHDITQHLSATVAAIIQELASQCNPDIPAVLAGHLTVSNGIFSGSEKRAVYGTDPLFLPSQLAISPFDYVALGHLHRYQNLNPNGYPAVIYSGSVERIDFGERKEEKGFCLVKIPEKNKCTHEFILTPTRPFIQINIVLSSNENTHTQEILEAIMAHSIEQAVVKIVYHVPANCRNSVDMNAVHRALSSAHYIASIIALKEIPTNRSTRTPLTVSVPFEQLLTEYFKRKPELASRATQLVEKAQRLRNELEDSTTTE